MNEDERLRSLGPNYPVFQEIPDELQKKLYAELKHYSATYSGLQDPERSFDLAMLMFPSITRFLWMAFHPTEKFLSALIDLRMAVESVRDGRESPLLPRKRGRGRPSMSFAAERDLALACVLLELHLRNGLTEVESAKRVVKIIRKSSIQLPKATHSSARKDFDRLLDFRQRVRSSRVTESLRWAYDSASSAIPKELEFFGGKLDLVISAYEDLLLSRGPVGPSG